MTADTRMRVDFLGTRGAFPLNIPETQRLGTETSCVMLTVGADRLILDAGTGLNRIAPSEGDDLIVLTHFHYDHVLGLPYFLSRKKEGRVTLITSCADDVSHFENKLSHIFGGIGFPVELSEIFANTRLIVGSESECIHIDPWTIDSIALNHPGHAFGYAVAHASVGERLCYLMDHEHDAEYPTEALARFAHEAALVIYDAAYSDADYMPHAGYGHSTIEEGQRFRVKSQCQQIAFMGHAMERLDVDIGRITDMLDPTREILAYDGLSISL